MNIKLVRPKQNNRRIVLIIVLSIILMILNIRCLHKLYKVTQDNSILKSELTQTEEFLWKYLKADGFSKAAFQEWKNTRHEIGEQNAKVN
jgi:hypothetical protein